MRISAADTSETGQVGSMRTGKLVQKFLLTGQDGSPNNYLLNVGLTGSGGWGTPRHRHNFDQIRYVLRGKYPVSPHKMMGEGSVAYFPESVHYGPQDRPEGLEMMVIQFGGASGAGFLSTPEREAANARLEAKGTFKDGIFTWVDDKGQKHNMDGSAACFEEATGQKLTFAPARYDDVVMMEPAACDWVPTGIQGVFTKTLGIFTERGVGISMMKLDAGTIWNTGTRSQIDILFMSTGSITVNGAAYGDKTGIEILPTDAPVDIAAGAESTFLVVTLPRF